MVNQIIFDDCFSALLNIKSNSIDLILTDPPYSISKKSNFKKGSDNIKFNKISIDFGDWDKDIDLEKLFKEYYRVLKPNGSLVIFYDIWKSDKIKKAAKISKFKQNRIGMWIKNNPTPVNSKINYLSNAVEYFFTFVKKNKPVFNSEYDKGIYNYPLCHGKQRTIHPNQKPLDLFKDLILKHSNNGDTILDTFGGSGTTAVASIETGRNYIIIENDKEYIDIIKSRLNV